MRNQIGIPPIERTVDAGAGAPLAPGANAPKGSHRLPHAGMDAKVAEAARHDDLPYVGGFDKPITERDTNVGLYVGVTIGVIAIILVVMLFSAIS